MTGGQAYFRVTAINGTAGSPGPGARLWGVTVNTGVATAVLTIYNDTAATVGREVAVINAASPGSYNFWGLRMDKGLFVKQTVAAADNTIVYE